MDYSSEIAAQIQRAASIQQGVYLNGGGSKSFYGRQLENDLETVQVGGHQGIVNYEPTELVVSVRAGTTIQNIKETLSKENQTMTFDPPEFSGKATIGGTLATGFSGPSRPYAGSIRDHVLGTHIINGKGEYLRFGGEVMKNVAGYDIARLMAGSMGTLGPVMQVSLKVLPKPQLSTTLVFEQSRQQALLTMNSLGDNPMPVTGACFWDEKVYIRLSGSEAGVRSASTKLGGDHQSEHEQIWTQLRELKHPFFNNTLPLWRISLPALTDFEIEGRSLIDWGGQQWWLFSNESISNIRLAANKAGGHATLFRGGDRQAEVFHPLPPAMASIQSCIRRAFDPVGIFNPGVQYK